MYTGSWVDVTVLSLVLLNTPVQQNVISQQGKKPLPKVFTQVPSQAIKIPIRLCDAICFTFE